MADFGKILDEWDRRAVRDFRRPERAAPEDDRRRTGDSRAALERALLEGVPPIAKDDEGEPEERLTKSEIEALPVDAVLDLHGMTAVAAEEALSLFFRDAVARRLRKVLVIHGKGNHSEGEPVLGRTVRRFLETSPLAGRHGTAERKQGGSGAVWVVLRTGDQRSR